MLSQKIHLSKKRVKKEMNEKRQLKEADASLILCAMVYHSVLEIGGDIDGGKEKHGDHVVLKNSFVGAHSEITIQPVSGHHFWHLG